MRIWVGVENFAKIEKAKICVDNYTILVGPNNSGKTFLMQLVQGVNRKISDLLDDIDMDDYLDDFLAEEDEAHKEYIINHENISELVSLINEKLMREKERIVKDIFGKEIAIENLYIDLGLEENMSYSLLLIDCNKKEKMNYLEKPTNKIQEVAHNIVSKLNEGLVLITSQKDHNQKRGVHLSLRGAFNNDISGLFAGAVSSVIERNSLFLPASRTGLLLLYREFFANKTDNELAYVVKDDRLVQSQEKMANLTQPMYEFLRFLQTYSESEEMKEKFSAELAFFEEHLIEGHISVDKQGSFSYDFKSGKGRVPMYLASSMINEVAPLVLAITSQASCNRLIIDEVEASLHPHKQLELVRFLNRLNNKGMKLIVSTHSDTFASKLNNLYLLAEATKKYGDEILRQFNLEKEDLIIPENLFVYEFRNQKNGKYAVKEIVANEKMGYQFDLFTESAMHLYDEAVKLGEIHYD